MRRGGHFSGSCTDVLIQNTEGLFQTDMFANGRGNNGNSTIQHFDLSKSFDIHQSFQDGILIGDADNFRIRMAGGIIEEEILWVLAL